MIHRRDVGACLVDKLHRVVRRKSFVRIAGVVNSCGVVLPIGIVFGVGHGEIITNRVLHFVQRPSHNCCFALRFDSRIIGNAVFHDLPALAPDFEIGRAVASSAVADDAIIGFDFGAVFRAGRAVATADDDETLAAHAEAVVAVEINAAAHAIGSLGLWAA